MKAALPEYLVPSFMLAYKSAMRREEIYSLEIEQYNPYEKQLILEPLDTKTKEQRILDLDPEMNDEIIRLIDFRNANFPDCQYIFYNAKGEKVKDFRDSWDTALLKAGFGLKFICKECKKTLRFDHKPLNSELVCSCGCNQLKRDNKLFHDLRRTGIRNLRRAGVSEDVAMRISGHKTREVFKRYNITSEQDLHDAAEKSYEYQKKKEADYLKATEPIEPEPTEPTTADAEAKNDEKVVSLQAYRKKKVS